MDTQIQNVLNYVICTMSVWGAKIWKVWLKVQGCFYFKSLLGFVTVFYMTFRLALYIFFIERVFRFMVSHVGARCWLFDFFTRL